MTPLADLLICLRFFSRLPVPTTPRESQLGAGGFAAAAAMAPFAGVMLSLVPIAVLLAARATHLPTNLAAPLAVASLVAVTGALHEDALADCADGFGGGRTRERKLDIMRDSRVGAFGAAAIALSLYIRAAALSAAAARSTGAAVIALILAAAFSRAAAIAPLVVLPPARTDGLGAKAARPGWRGAFVATILIAVFAIVDGAGAARTTVALVAAALAGLGLCAIARWQIQGQTGDVAGAAQQLAEASVLVVFAAAS